MGDRAAGERGRRGLAGGAGARRQEARREPGAPGDQLRDDAGRLGRGSGQGGGGAARPVHRQGPRVRGRVMLSPRLDSLGVRPLETEDAAELHRLVEANRAHLARWMPWAAGQDRDGTERFLAEAEAQHARDDGFQARIAPQGEIVGVVGFHSVDWVNRNTSLGYWLAADAQG